MSRELWTVCPWCGDRHDAVSETGGEDVLPEPGSITLCAACGRFCLFDDAMRLRRPTKAEGAAIATDKDCRDLLRAWRMSPFNEPKGLREPQGQRRLN